MTLTQFIQAIVNGLAIGAVYAIFAIGYTLIFSILRIINFAHGAVFTLGAYFTYALMGQQFGFNGLLAQAQLPFGLPFWLAIILGGVLAGLIGVVIERLTFRPLRARGADPLLTLVSSLGVAVAIVNIIQYLVGAENYSYPSEILGTLPKVIRFGTAPNLVLLRIQPLIIFAISMALVIALTYLINRTKTGQALRAVSEDGITANLLGINTDRMILVTFFLSGLIGGVAGTMVGLNSSISGPYFGINYGLKGLAVIVLGGLGDIPGAIVGGLAIGLAEAFVPAEFNAFKDAVAFIVLFIILLIRPQGILGRAVVQKV